MNDYGESSTMTWRCKMLGYILLKARSLEGELRSNGAAATQNCLETFRKHDSAYLGI